MKIHTFVIPAYNESPYLEQCIQSLRAQKHESQIIITTSTPNNYIKTLVDKYQLDYFINNSDEKGIASNWNFALSKSSTVLTTIAHQDDIYLPDFSEQIIKAYNANCKDWLIAFTGYKVLVGTAVRNISLNDIVKKILLFPFLFKKNIHSPFIKKMILALGDPIGCPTVTYNSLTLNKFSFSEKYACILDWFAWYELASRNGSFFFINQTLMLHRIHAASETSNLIKNGKRKLEETELLRKIWGKYFAKLLIAVYELGHKQNKV